MALFPEKTYAKVPGTYFVPTGTCLRNWMQRAGFADVKIFCSHPMSSAEQRRTGWMVFESYSDFLDPGDPSLTVEGYPSPYRVFLSGRKG
jgi:tRNA (mo5U34)-methyltransferase